MNLNRLEKALIALGVLLGIEMCILIILLIEFLKFIRG